VKRRRVIEAQHKSAKRRAVARRNGINPFVRDE
jgi:hypothetical protein